MSSRVFGWSWRFCFSYFSEIVFTKKNWYNYRIKEGFVGSLRNLWVADNQFEGVLGYYETFLRVSILFQRRFRRLPFSSVLALYGRMIAWVVSRFSIVLLSQRIRNFKEHRRIALKFITFSEKKQDIFEVNVVFEKILSRLSARSML